MEVLAVVVLLYIAFTAPRVAGVLAWALLALSGALLFAAFGGFDAAQGWLLLCALFAALKLLKVLLASRETRRP